jgi:dihydrofolate reductase
MGKLIYFMNVSVDGFVETPDHGLDWGVIDDELHSLYNDQMRGVDASLYGRRLYEVMAAYWPTGESDPAATDVTREFARLWNATPRFVFSNSRESVDFNSRLATGDVGEELAAIKAEFEGDLEVGGPTLAAQFIERGLVDEYHLVIHPVVLGAGTPFFPRLDRPIGLKLIDTRVFGSGVVYQSYAATHE